MTPPSAPLLRLLDRKRRDDPSRVAHAFRHLHQASCYWLEGLSWVGESWNDLPPVLVEAEAGEPEDHRIARTLHPLLGRLNGTIEDQWVNVTRVHVGDIVVWLGERTIDWNRPVRLEVDGRLVFKGRVERDPRVALARAAATMDFESLRFAGIRVDQNGVVSMVTAATMPAPIWRSGELAAVVATASAPSGDASPAAPVNRELEQVLGRAGDAVALQVRESTTVLAEEQCRQSTYETTLPDPGGAIGGRVRTAGRALEGRSRGGAGGDTRAGEARGAVARESATCSRWTAARCRPRRRGSRACSSRGGCWRGRGPARIIEENARYNLGPVSRSVNAPAVPLLVLYPPNRERFAFRKAGEQTIDGALT